MPRASPPPPYDLLEKLEALEHEIVRGLVARFRLHHPLRHLPARLVAAGFVLVGGFVTIGLLAGLAMVSRTPFVFPSLGPTAFLLFFHPRAPTASPRNALFGHALGILCGYAALCLVGLEHAPSAMQEGITGARVLAAALSLAATGAAMVLIRVVHPPAGATTLIVSLGIVGHPFHLVVIELAVALLVLQALVINRLAGIDYPLWRSPAPPRGRAGSSSRQWR